MKLSTRLFGQTLRFQERQGGAGQRRVALRRRARGVAAQSSQERIAAKHVLGNAALRPARKPRSSRMRKIASRGSFRTMSTRALTPVSATGCRRAAVARRDHARRTRLRAQGASPPKWSRPPQDLLQMRSHVRRQENAGGQAGQYHRRRQRHLQRPPAAQRHAGRRSIAAQIYEGLSFGSAMR